MSEEVRDKVSLRVEIGGKFNGTSFDGGVDALSRFVGERGLCFASFSNSSIFF